MCLNDGINKIAFVYGIKEADIESKLLHNQKWRQRASGGREM